MILRGLILVGALLLAGCVHTPGCDGSGGSIAAMQCRAWSGDKLAQLEMGKRLETGDGVAINLKQAAHFYRIAAQDVSGTAYVYSPPVGKRGRGMVLPIRTGADQRGLAEAKYRLGKLNLEGRGISADKAKGEKLIRQALAEGYKPRDGVFGNDR